MYRQFTEAERYTLSAFRRARWSVRSIAEKPQHDQSGDPAQRDDRSPQAEPVLRAEQGHGTEFHGYRALEQATDVRCYFAYPYHPWERGSNENLNGVLRQYFWKGNRLARVRQCGGVRQALNEQLPQLIFSGMQLSF